MNIFFTWWRSLLSTSCLALWWWILLNEHILRCITAVHFSNFIFNQMQRYLNLVILFLHNFGRILIALSNPKNFWIILKWLSWFCIVIIVNINTSLYILYLLFLTTTINITLNFRYIIIIIIRRSSRLSLIRSYSLW